MNRLFEIQTLSDCGNPHVYNRLGQSGPPGQPVDPFAVITGGIGVLSNLFPNIFGGARKKLTSADWLQLIPGSGHWTTKLRNYLAIRIHYDVDAVANIQPFTVTFVWNNGAQICGHAKGTWGAAGPDTEQKCMQRFFDILREEQRTGGTSPIGQTPGGFGSTINYESLILLGGGLLLAMAVFKKKK